MAASTATSEFDLDAYLRRIGVPRTDVSDPDHDTLGRIALAHTRSISFENLDVFTGHEVSLDPSALTAKLVGRRRGGWCFEQNLLLNAALTALGYSTTCLTGRVLWGLSAETPLPPRTHMLLRVDLPEGPHIVDAGFGIASITGVLALEPDIEQSTPHNTFRLVPDKHAYRLEAQERNSWRVMYRFDLAESSFSDFTMANFYLAHNPDSVFRNELMLARADVDRRYTLHGSKAGGVRLGVRHVDGPVERRTLNSPAEVRAAFEQEFQLDLDGLTDLDAALNRLF